MKRLHSMIAAIALLACLLASPTRADVFVLSGEGQVRGELLNRDESPRKTYVIKTTSGGQVTLEASQVKEVKKQSAAELKYDKVRGDYADTAEDQWKLAQWCQENHLSKQRKIHAERVIELDPDHSAARRALGYGRIRGRWTTQAELMTENGYVRYGSKWVLPQEIELLEEKKKEDLAEKDWNRKLKRWQGWLSNGHESEAIEEIKQISDPFAARPLARALSSESRRDVRLLYVDALGRLESASGLDALVSASLNDIDDEVRMASLDHVVAHKYRPASLQYIRGLKSKDNVMVNRAALCLGRMHDPSAVGPLIDALVTTHTFQIQKGSPGQTQAAFGTGANNTGGGGFTFGGGGVEIVKQVVENRNVLQSLIELTSGVNFDFDVKAWKHWYVSQRKPQTQDTRRD